MFEYKKNGDKEILEQVEMPESTKELLTEVLAQNRMVIEANSAIITRLMNPLLFIGKDD